MRRSSQIGEMLRKSFAIVPFVMLLAAIPAFAACPAPAAGDTPEAIRANQDRLVCLQRELARLGEQNATQFEIDQIGRNLDSMQLQQRFEALDFTYHAPPPPFP